MEKQSLQDMWDDASNRFRKLTGKILTPGRRKTLDEVCEEMEAQQSQDPTDNDLNTRAKQIGINLLQGLKLLGGVVAQGVSMVGFLILRV